MRRVLEPNKTLRRRFHLLKPFGSNLRVYVAKLPLKQEGVGGSLAGAKRELVTPYFPPTSSLARSMSEMAT